MLRGWAGDLNTVLARNGILQTVPKKSQTRSRAGKLFTASPPSLIGLAGSTVNNFGNGIRILRVAS